MAILTALLSNMRNAATIISELPMVFVADMPDGGMGGIVFVGSDQRKRCFGEVLAEAEFLDIDGVRVIISINTDNLGRLYELDLWKTDFSPLREYPSPEALHPIRPKSRTS